MLQWVKDTGFSNVLCDFQYLVWRPLLPWHSKIRFRKLSTKFICCFLVNSCPFFLHSFNQLCSFAWLDHVFENTLPKSFVYSWSIDAHSSFTLSISCALLRGLQAAGFVLGNVVKTWMVSAIPGRCEGTPLWTKCCDKNYSSGVCTRQRCKNMNV